MMEIESGNEWEDKEGKVASYAWAKCTKDERCECGEMVAVLNAK